MADTPGRAVRGADLVVLAVPPRATIDLIGRLGPALEPGARADRRLQRQGAGSWPRASEAGLTARFAGGHPLAGTHDSGFSVGAAGPPSGLRRLRMRGCTAGGHRPAARVSPASGSTPCEASPIRIRCRGHDRQLAWTSHLPQAVAYALARTLAEHGLGGCRYGTGAKDTTRLAASNPEMWIDILLYNRPAVSRRWSRPTQPWPRCGPARHRDPTGPRALPRAPRRPSAGALDR